MEGAASKMIKAILFDMDGVIIDSLPFHKSIRRELGKKYGFDFSDEFVDRINGMDSPKVAEILEMRLGVEAVRGGLRARLGAPDHLADGLPAAIAARPRRRLVPPLATACTHPIEGV